MLIIPNFGQGDQTSASRVVPATIIHLNRRVRDVFNVVHFVRNIRRRLQTVSTTDRPTNLSGVSSVLLLSNQGRVRHRQRRVTV